MSRREGTTNSSKIIFETWTDKHLLKFNMKYDIKANFKWIGRDGVDSSHPP